LLHHDNDGHADEDGGGKVEDFVEDGAEGGEEDGGAVGAAVGEEPLEGVGGRHGLGIC